QIMGHLRIVRMRTSRRVSRSRGGTVRRGPWSAAVAAVERRSASTPRCGARDRVDDELGVVADPADQRRAARVLQVHAEEVQPGRIADAAPMAGRAALVEDWNLDPR